nr:receptor-like protein 18 [Arachis hypogaea]
MGSLLLLQFQIILCLHMFFTSFSSSSSLSLPLCHPDQNSALLQLKNSLKVDGWENGTDCCSWPAVTCESTSGHVIGLDLSWHGLEGKNNSTSSLFHLTHLQKINLAHNSFYGPLLPSQFGGFVNLTHLNLSWCSFEGDIPSKISYLSKLVSLDLSGNLNLKWTETTWKRLLRNAEIFLDYTDMSSIRLSSLSLITNWSFSSVTLGLSNTNITGYLTSDILCLPNLKELHLYGNTYLQVHVSRLNCNASVSILDLSFCEFQGSMIPSSFSNLTYLTSLTLFECGLNGSIPSSLSNLQHLTHLDLSSNSIFGSILSSFSNLQHLTYLDLSNNNLTGALQDLVVLDLSYNELSGQLPDIFGGLNKLQTLNLGKNKIQGKLPFSLFTLTQLSILDFSSNKFEGPLPNQIAGFSNLTELYLDDNLLNGTIPSWCLSLPLLKHLNLSSNQFTGNLSEISSYSLLYLNLCGNKIHGDIQKSIFDLVNLTELCLSSDNHGGFVKFSLFSKLQNLSSLTLSGYESISLKSDVNANYTFSNLEMLHLSSNTMLDFPKFSGKFPRLLILDLSNNKLQGKVPKWIHDLDSLYHLNLSTNQLTSIEKFSWHGLQYLDLSSNLMTNEISSILCNISSLEVVDLSNNYFTGTIPQCLSNLSYLEVLDLRMNKLYGT